VQTTTSRSYHFPVLDLLSLGDVVKTVRKGDYLFYEGMDAEELYIIRSGLIQISKITVDGKELCLRVCQKNDLVGELSLFTNHSQYMLNAKALMDSEVVVISKTRLEEALYQNPTLNYEFMKWMSEQFRRTFTKFRDLLLYGKKGALYSTLIRLSNSYGIQTDEGIFINLSLTNQQLANFCGSTRESINRMLSELKSKKIISFSDGKMVIHDIDYLKKEINCENCPANICRIE
jgi:CRP-like cAMP-binding protein